MSKFIIVNTETELVTKPLYSDNPVHGTMAEVTKTLEEIISDGDSVIGYRIYEVTGYKEVMVTSFRLEEKDCYSAKKAVSSKEI